MRKAIIFLFILLSAHSAKAQPSAPTDTLAYLQNIVNNKAQYIGQPFSTLANSLLLSIKYFHPHTGDVQDISKETSTRFAFYFPQNAEDLYLTYHSIEIYWQPTLNANQSGALWVNNNGGGWSSSVDLFYSARIISDIKLRE